MSIQYNIKPRHISGFIRNWILPDDMTVTKAAKHLGVSRQSLDALLNERRSLTPEMAKRFELAFGGSAELLLRMQARYELYLVEQKADEIAKSVSPISHKPEAA